MNQPTMFETRKVAPDTTSLNAYIPIPGFGVLPVNAFVIQAQEPVLVDTGLQALRTDFMRELHNVLDPNDLRWIWITHTDADHLGNLEAVLAEAPNARIVTTYLGMGKMGMHGLPLDRVYLLNPGQCLNVGDRKLQAIAPPTFDAPETTGLFDSKTAALFSADSFGALLDKPVEKARDISQQMLREGCISWATVDAPWLSMIDPGKFTKALGEIDKLNVNTILSAHLPPAEGLAGQLLEYVKEAQEAPAFVGPDQQALEKMLAA
ncbi:oxygen-binding di-iron domain-containing protein [Kaarinaea lacus]